MKTYHILIVVLSLILLGCYALPLGGGAASVITTSKNFTMNENSEDTFGLLEGDSTTTHTVTVSKVELKAAMLKIDSQPLIMQIGEVRSVSIGQTTVLVSIDSIDNGYVRFSISLPGQSQQGGTTPQGTQNGTQQQLGLKQNGANCTSNSDCQSNYCNNYCCASGACCISDSNCSIGRCNTTSYSCFTVTLLSNGAPCTSNSNCQSNYCSNNYCCNSGNCCLSNSNCPSGQVCNTSTSSCAQPTSLYSAVAAEQLANSTTVGILMGRFASIFNSARQCSSANSAYLQCIPRIATREEQVSPSTYRVIYYNSFNGASCCTNEDLVVIAVELSTNSTAAPQWLDTSFTSSVADSMQSSINSNCASAVLGMACKTS